MWVCGCVCDESQVMCVSLPEKDEKKKAAASGLTSCRLLSRRLLVRGHPEEEEEEEKKERCQANPHHTRAQDFLVWDGDLHVHQVPNENSSFLHHLGSGFWGSFRRSCQPFFFVIVVLYLHLH